MNKAAYEAGFAHTREITELILANLQLMTNPGYESTSLASIKELLGELTTIVEKYNVQGEC